MFYSLNEQYRLRGWDKLPTGVVKHLAGNVVFLDPGLCSMMWNPECESCEYRNRCAGGCRGQAAYGGSLTGKDESACAFYKNGWYDKVKSKLDQLSTKE